MRSLSRRRPRHNSMVNDFVPGPVFYDRTGKRLYYFIASVFVIGVVIAVLPVRVTPMVFDPVWHVPTNGESGYPRRLLSSLESQRIPILGEENRDVISRIVQVDRRSNGANPG